MIPTPLILLILGCLFVWFSCHRVNSFQKSAFEGHHCVFYIDNDRVQGLIIAADEWEVAIFYNNKTYLRSRSEIYPV
jgi:hypothetical protein